MASRYFPVLVALAIACGGKSPRSPVRRPPPNVPAPAVTTSPSAVPPSGSLLSSLAPEPSIRIGLTTSAPVVRLTSPRPFRVGSGSVWIETAEVLVRPERETSAPIEGSTYRVEVASFPAENAAVEFRARALSDLAELAPEIVVVREPSSGRYSVRLGAFPTESGAEIESRELARLGFDSSRVVREPASAPRATALVLVAAGAPPVRIDSLALTAVPTGLGAFLEVDSRPYRGFVQISVNGSNALTVTNVVHLEDYLRGVVPAELSPEGFPEKEALKSQAIAARTYAVKRKGQFEAEGYDLCATPACQVYRGVGVEHRLSNAAVQETEDEILTYEGKPVDALYTSTCGGRTESAENVFSTSEPYLVSRACALESSRGLIAQSANPGPLSLEAAMLYRIGVLERPSEEGEANYAEVLRWTELALGHLGQSPCWRDAASAPREPFDVLALARLLGEALCWERRLPFLVSPIDAEIIAGADIPEPDRMSVSEALRDGLIVADGAGLRPGTSLSRREAISTLYRMVAKRGEPILREGRLKTADSDRITIVEEDQAGVERELVMSFGPLRYLYREVAGSTYYVSRTALLPNDRVNYHAGDEGIDALVIVDGSGGSFDRSSRFSHWIVRKTAEELTREVNLRNAVGAVKELRPMRYGLSGRLAELEIVGDQATVTLRGLAIRRALGIRENLFFFDPQYEAEGTVRGWVFTGRGWGHGVGLCQVGAYGMAAAGYSYRDILVHYYPGTRIDKHPGRP